MKTRTVASLIGLKPEFAERYIILHRHTFPGVLARLHASHIVDYTIFEHKGILFSHLVWCGEDYESDMAAIAADPVTREWWKLTDAMQQPLPTRKTGEWWQTLEELARDSAATAGELVTMPHRDRSLQRFAFTAPLAAPAGRSLAPAEDRLNLPASPGNSAFPVKIFSSASDYYIYFEAADSTTAAAYAASLASHLGLVEQAAAMIEVFHSHPPVSERSFAKKAFVTGCFDMLHSGHIAFLTEAAEYGDLYVSIGSDANVHHLKGRYPVNSQEERKYMLDALASVHECRINSGWGILDFEKELRDILPDIFIVNEDGHTPAKQALCHEMGIDYKVLRRIPHENLPVRSTTALRTECTIPFRIDLAGGWLDQPFVSRHHPGAVLTISIEPTVEFNERSGMASSTRRKAIELWGNEIPRGDREQLARILFSFENPPGTREVAGSQDSLGIVMPGLARLDYDNHYWPNKITTVLDEGTLTWLEKSLYLVTLGPRMQTYDVLANTRIDVTGARALADATNACWEAIRSREIRAFGAAFRASFEAQIAMFPNMVGAEIMGMIDQYREKVLGWKLSGAGGGGYLIMVSHVPVEGAMQIKIRRKNDL